MQLRPYQTDLLAGIYNAWGSYAGTMPMVLIDGIWQHQGHRNVLAVAPTGSGKTVLFSEAIRLHRGACVAIAHRQELVSQMSLALARDEVRHRIIGPQSVVRDIVQIHIEELGRDYYDPSAGCAVAGVDTLVRRGDELAPWCQQVTLWVQDEGHHQLTSNKWGTAAAMFPNAHGLLVTATPERADGKGLGRHADGLVDVMIEGPGMRQLITEGYLTDYRVFCPPSDLDLSTVSTGKDGDYIRGQLALKTRSSTIMGHVVEHYLRIAPGKLGVTFAPDVETATDFSVLFNRAGVPAEVVSAKTPDRMRREILRRFRRGDVKQLVNCDLFGEGFDLPAIEVVTMARATESYGLYCLDPDTEVLTPDGWKLCDSVGDEVIAFNQQDNTTHIVPVTQRVKRSLYQHEKMYQMKGPHLDFCVSDKHDLLIKGGGADWTKQTAESVARRKTLFRVPVAGEGIFKGSGLTDNELRFLGWFLSDGSINKITNGLLISQAINKKLHHDSIRSALKGCGFKFTEKVVVRKNVPPTHQNLLLFTISKGIPRGTDKHLTGWGRLEQWVNKTVPSCYDSLTKDEFLILLETLNLGDGTNEHRSLDYIKNTLTIACGINYVMADRLQTLCVTRGIRCNLSIVQYGDRSKWAYLHIRRNKNYSTIAGTSDKNGMVSNKKPYTRSRILQTDYQPEFVWCVSNSLGTLITRRNGKVIIVGNCQQFGRGLRIMDGKDRAIIIDHVGNVVRHGLPDSPRVWTLDRRERRGGASDPSVIPLRNCLNPECMAPFERVHPACPFCGWVPVPAGRTAPELVDGDLFELDPEVLAAMRGELEKVDRHPDAVRDMMKRAGAPPAAYLGAAKQHTVRQAQQAQLRELMAMWMGYQKAYGRGASEAQRRFYHRFGSDVLSAQCLGRTEAEGLMALIGEDIVRGVA